MAKPAFQYVCQSCGSVSPKWSGQCPDCGEWNSLQQETTRIASVPKSYRTKAPTRSEGMELVSLDRIKPESSAKRHLSGDGEFDRVTGGGLVGGSALLIGGDPGIGKSTLLLQIMAALSGKGLNCVYISGEEALTQIHMRAERLGLDKNPVEMAVSTRVEDMLALMRDPQRKPDVMVIDSIQTMFLDAIESAPGTVGQVRACAHELIRVAKKTETTLLIVGHVTKEGQIAGPRVLEHMVDTVLYFEGDRGHQFRILRAVKNRFGPTDEIGVFEMQNGGLVQVANPSALFLSQRQENVAGSAVLAGLEGTRPVLVEVQALVAPTSFATPRRAVIGWDGGRLAMVTAVLESRCGLQFSGCDIYLNIAGGIRIQEPAADLAVCAALISALRNSPLPHDLVLFGEVGLAGEIRSVAQPDVRLKEARKLGFKNAFVPKTGRKNGKKSSGGTDFPGLEITPLLTMNDLISGLN